MMREDWRLVGEALLVGRRLHPSNIAFSRWCKENGFGDMGPSVRSNTMWLAEHWNDVLQSLQDGDCHPTAIRAAYNAALAGTVETDEDEEADTDTTPAPALASRPGGPSDPGRSGAFAQAARPG